jgi:phage gp46-like protein
MQFDGDPKIISYGSGTDLEIVGGQPTMDQGLYNAVHLSLFSAAGWWGNSVSAPSERLTSQFETINTRTLTNATRLDAEEYARQALSWMIADGIAKKITVTASIPAVGMLGLVIEVEQPDRSSTIRYQVSWADFALSMGAA